MPQPLHQDGGSVVASAPKPPRYFKLKHMHLHVNDAGFRIGRVTAPSLAARAMSAPSEPFALRDYGEKHCWSLEMTPKIIDSDDVFLLLGSFHILALLARPASLPMVIAVCG